MKSIDKKLHLLVWSLVLIIFLPALFTKGMFLDGITYAAISKNMASGLGSMWKPYYTSILYPDFFEHPPMAFIIQSFFFRLFGNAFWIEKLYSFLFLIATLGGIMSLWHLQIKKHLKSKSWLVVILFLSIPIVLWSYKNNMLENTMSVFSLYSILFILIAIKKNKLIYLLLSSLLIVAAFFTKGFTGIFPLALPFFFLVLKSSQSKKRILFMSIIGFLLPILMLSGIFLLIPESMENIKAYLNIQFFPAISNEREITTTSHFFILMRLMIELTAPLISILLIILIRKGKTKKLSAESKQTAFLFLIIGLSASIPLMITLKQRGFYLVTALPYFAIAIAIWMSEQLSSENLPSNLKKSIIPISLLIIGFSIFLTVSNYGSSSRDKLLISDIETIQTLFPENKTLCCSKELQNHWLSIAYLNRYGGFSLEHKADCDQYLDFNIESFPHKDSLQFYRIVKGE